MRAIRERWISADRAARQGTVHAGLPAWSACLLVLACIALHAPAHAATDFLSLRERLQVERPKLREAMQPYRRAAEAQAFATDKPGVAFGKYLDQVWRVLDAKTTFPEVYTALRGYSGKLDPSDPTARQALGVLLGDYMQVRYGDDIVRELRGVVAHKTFDTVVDRNAENPEFKACFDALASLGNALGLKVENRAYQNLLVTLPATGAAASAAPCGVWTHADVPRPIEHKWASPPWTLTERNNRLAGAGVYDDKGPIVVNLFALRALRDANLQLARPVVLAVSSNAQSTGADAAASFSGLTPAPAVVLAADASFPYGVRQLGRLQARVSSTRGMKTRTGIRPGQFYIFKIKTTQGNNTVPSEARVWVRYQNPLNVSNPALVQTNRWRAEIEGYQKGHTTSVYETYIQEDTLHFFVYGVPGHVEHADQTVNSIYDAAGALQGLDLFQNSASDVMLWVDKALQHDFTGKGLGIAFEHPEMGGTRVSPVGFDRLGDEVTVLVDIRWPLGHDKTWIQEKTSAAVRAFNEKNGTKLAIAWDPNSREPIEQQPPRAVRDLLDEAFALASGEGASPGVASSCATLLPGTIPFGPEWPRGNPHAHTRDESISPREIEDLGVASVTALALLGSGPLVTTP